MNFSSKTFTNDYIVSQIFLLHNKNEIPYDSDHDRALMKMRNSGLSNILRERWRGVLRPASRLDAPTIVSINSFLLLYNIFLIYYFFTQQNAFIKTFLEPEPLMNLISLCYPFVL